MSISKTYSAQLSGLQTNIINIEVDLSNGLHAFVIVGLGDKAVEESKDRISAAIKNSGYTSPKQKNQKVVISLAPADIRKEGPSFDLGMALAYLCASGDIDFDPKDKIFLGELSLEGRIRKVSGILPLVAGAVLHGYKEIFVPSENAVEAALVEGIKIYPAESLDQIIGHLTLGKSGKIHEQSRTKVRVTNNKFDCDFNAIRGQEMAKRALEVAAAGGHNICMYGPPGTGKTMLAKAFPTILPPLSKNEVLEVTSIHSIAKTLTSPFITRPPFRSPHHTSSYASLVGGGAFPRPGEVSLAHRGILFLDEFPEFDKKVIESLRQPLEDRTVTISRAKGTLSFPANCTLIASMNPCPCGYGKDNRCICTKYEISNYQKRISGPIIDRIDIWVSVSKIEYNKLSIKSSENESSETIRKRVVLAHKKQKERFVKNGIVNKKHNGEMSVSDIEKIVKLNGEGIDLLTKSSEKLGLSARTYHKIIKLSQTLADLEGVDEINTSHILEALQYRQKILT
jgi:magnesium chelatase family protein